MKWEECMFCQVSVTKQKLSAVTTFKASQHTFESAKYEQRLSARLASVNDLIGAKGKHHPNCYK